MYPYPAGQAWITSWGLVLLLAVAACWALARRNARRCDLDPSHVDLVIPVALVLGILASRAASALLPADRLLAGTEWVAASRVRLIPVALGGIAAVLLYARVTSQSGRRLLDVLALPALAGLGIQRVGCFLAGCCWGDVAVRSEQLDLLAGSGLGPQLQTFPWAVGGWGLAVAFPAGSFAWEQHRVAGLIPPEAAASLPVLPTQLYEAVLVLALALGLWRTRAGRRTPGGVLLACVVGYASLGFAVAFLRADAPLVLGPLTVTQLQCVGLFLVAGGALLGLTRRDAVAPARFAPKRWRRRNST